MFDCITQNFKRRLLARWQFGIAFAAYVADFDCFPVDDYNTYASVTVSWGGVDWYLDDADVQIVVPPDPDYS